MQGMRVIVYANNSVCIDGKDYADGSRQALEVFERYGIERERGGDSKHRELDGTRITLYATRIKFGGWSKTDCGNRYRNRVQREDARVKQAPLIQRIRSITNVVVR
jgi:hypothetical protein